ncbi:MAG TPA: ATP-binding cassette domain-containing protein [Solirubrobacteraceae bacterium]|jgi:ABC-2 type transport system ATP-binding protein|nr:ATP-binding cassette domain-containing protein [Solirubrobacteraceae bacterium]
MIEAFGLTKRYGDKLAVDDLSFTVPAGQVTGFLGPNGAGKSTTMRMVLGLDAPTAGSVTVNGRPYVEYRRPLLEVGALLEAKAIHDGRSAYNHLLCLAQSNGIRRSRVDEALDTVGLREVARKRSGGFSLGMGQRLGIAAALLGDPKVLMFDEPVNGLDPEGVLWIRNLLKKLAGEGRTVFVSSHLMSEMSITADRLVIIGRGRLIAETTVDEFLKGGTGNFVRVRSPQADQLVRLLKAQGVTAVRDPDGALSVTGVKLEAVGDLAGANGLTLHELSAHTASLEDTFMELTRDSVDFRTDDGALDPALVPAES